MTKLYALLFLTVAFVTGDALAQNVTTNAHDAITPYTGKFRPGVNLRYLPPWNTFQLGDLAAGNPSLGVQGVGARSTRPGLFDYVLDQYGYGLNVDAFEYYRDLGMEELTAIVGFPSDSHRAWSERYCPTTEKWNAHFEGIYEPIWDGGANGTPYNEDNEYAAYLYQIVSLYTDNVRFWEIWNEPGLYTGNDSQVFWGEPDYPGSWWVNDPDPCDYSLHAPVEHYVRILRISYEIIKSISPDDYVAVAGLGSRSFLDAILRNTDNPGADDEYFGDRGTGIGVGESGSPTADFPYGAGAYIDVVGFHTYPHLDGSTSFSPDNYFERHSDGAADGLINRRLAGYQQVLHNYGYDGVTYPEKLHICTEINVPREIFSGNYFGGEQEQVNFISKALIGLKINDIHQMHVYSISDKVEEWEADFEFDLMGLYKKLEGVQPYNQELNDEGIAYKTAADLVYPTEWDEAKTVAMNAPDGVRAYAFAKPDGTYLYALWAETRDDLTERASKQYSFPASFDLTQVEVYEWDHSETGDTDVIDAFDIELDATPIFLVASDGGSTTNEAPVPTLTTATTTVDGDFQVDLAWSERVSGFSASDIRVINGSARALQGGARSYSFTVSPASVGDVTVSVPPGAAVDFEGLASVASNTLVVDATDTGGGGGTGSTDADVELRLTADALTVGDFENITFTLTVANTGGRDADEVVVEFPLPDDYSFVSVDVSAGDYSSWTGNWDVGTLAPGAAETVELTLFTLTEDARTAYAQVIGMVQFDPDSTPGNGSCCTANEDDEVALTINAGSNPPAVLADLSLELSSPQSAVGDDGVFEVMYTVRNAGPDATSGVMVDVTVPSGLTIVGSDIPGGTQLNGANWAVNRLNDTEFRTLMLRLRAADPSQQVALVAEVSASMQDDPDSVPGNGAAGEDDRAVLVLEGAPVAMADLELDIAASSDTYRKYTAIGFIITVSNPGAAPATDIVVGYPEPGGMIHLSAKSSQGAYSRNAADWDVGTLAPGESATLEVKYFTLSDNAAITAFAQVIQANAQDSDSTPNNRSCCTAVEDDEDVVVVQPDTATPPVVTNPGNFPTESPSTVILMAKPPGEPTARLTYTTTTRADAVLVDALGRFVQHYTLSTQPGTYQEAVDFSGLASGTYTLVVSLNGEQQAFKLVHTR